MVKFKSSGAFILAIGFGALTSCDKNEIKYEVDEGGQQRTMREMFQADPTIFSDGDTYYLYGTNDQDPNTGFQVFTSTNMETWWGPKGPRSGYALSKEDNFGNTGFWAPQVWKHHGKYYMAYTANENIAVSVSDDPLGPFVSETRRPVFSSGNQIDPFVFIDDDGKKYLFYVRLINGNRIYSAEMADDFMSVKTETIKESLHATEPWENTANAAWSVIEGPTVLKHKGYYYLVYSANDFRNPDYAVGYATSQSINGPWVKSSTNPILSNRNTGWAGSGHGDIAFDKDKNMFYVFHTHTLNNPVPRKTAIVKARFEAVSEGPDKLVFDGSSFYHLNSKQ